jgi:hypothetical protein
LADIVEEVSGLTVERWCEETGVSELVFAQAGIGATIGISFASFRRFWTVAARRNSSRGWWNRGTVGFFVGFLKNERAVNRSTTRLHTFSKDDWPFQQPLQKLERRSESNDELLYEANAQAAPDPISKRLRSPHQGWTRDKSGSVEIGRSPLDSRAAATIAGSGVRIGGIAW